MLQMRGRFISGVSMYLVWLVLFFWCYQTVSAIGVRVIGLSVTTPTEDKLSQQNLYCCM